MPIMLLPHHKPMRAYLYHPSSFYFAIGWKKNYFLYEMFNVYVYMFMLYIVYVCNKNEMPDMM